MLIALLALAGPATFQTPAVAPAADVAGSRIRIVPQSSDQKILDIEESLDGTRLLTHDRGFAPHLFDAHSQILLTVLDGHKEAVQQANFSPDGKRIVSVSDDQLRVWDSSRAKLITTFMAPKGEKLVRADLSPNASLVAASTQTGKIYLVNSNDGTQFSLLGSHTDSVECVEFSPDGSKLFTGSLDDTSHMWDVAAKKSLWEKRDHAKEVRWAIFSKDGSMVLDTGLDDKAMLYDTNSGALKQGYLHKIAPRGYLGNVQNGASLVGPNGDEVAAGKENGNIILYKAGTQDVLQKFEGHKAPLRELRTSFNRRYLGTYGDDDTLFCWDTVENKRIDITLDDSTPYAADFSPTRPVFWLGYADGEVGQYDLTTGKQTQATFGDTVEMSHLTLGGNDPVLGLSENYSAFAGNSINTLFLDGAGNRRAPVYESITNEMSISPSGQYAMAERSDTETPFMVFDIWNAKGILMLKDKPHDWQWSPDGTRAIMLFDNGECAVFDLASAKMIHSWSWPVDKQLGDLDGGVVHPNGKWIVTTCHPDGEALLWDMETGKEVQSLGKFDILLCTIRFSDDGKLVTLVSYDESKVLECETGKVICDYKYKGGRTERSQVSKDGSRILLSDDAGWTLVDTRTGQTVTTLKKADAPGFYGALDPLGKQMLAMDGRMVTMWDDSGKKVMDVPCFGTVSDVKFSADGKRIITVDSVGGGTIWDVKPSTDGSAIRLATIVLMRNGDWLVYDDQGRFDSTDPSNVTGAYFVLEWEGGLEPIAMPQLKSQFYEPNLLAKVMGLDKEPLRDVPSLNDLHLAPQITLEKMDKAFIYDVKVAERDNGGIGKLSFYLNGKQFSSKKGSKYVQLDLNSYANFMLPDTQVGDSGNVLAVSVSNEAGTLTSLPVTVNVGVPSSLKAPDVKLYALFVGVGDYPGTSGDLKAPPADAASLQEAIRATSEKLLPGHVVTGLMTTQITEGGQRPTKQHIMDWFKETAKTATSSDILMVFFAGHGVSKIGDQSGYFFLTSDADPGNVTPSSAATSMISGDELRAALAEIPANKQVVILDTCHSGAATDSLLSSDRSISGEYQRAWESIRDTTGTWLLAGSASDQLSYESSNVDHGMLTYSLLEAINNCSAEGLRETPSGQMFVDVEKWLNYAANRVESLKSEVGVKGMQRPEFKRATRGSSFDIGVMDPSQKGSLNLKAPMPVAIVGAFEMDQEDPAGLEPAIQTALKDSTKVKAWFDVAKHPNVYRVAGSYTMDGTKIKLKLYIQRFDANQERTTVQTLTLEGDKQALDSLAKEVRAKVEESIQQLTEATPRKE